jgi:drug/metabolite transporter (DMT)-like permease
MSKAMLIGAVVLWGLWGFAQKLASSRAHATDLAWMNAVPYAALLPALYLFGRRSAGGAPFDSIALGIAGLGAVAGIAAYYLLVSALKTEPASVAIGITAAYPLVTLLLAAAAGVEALSPLRMAGVAVIILGVVLIQWPEAHVAVATAAADD